MNDDLWTAIEKKAQECRRTWGMGFPVISLTLLEPFWKKRTAERDKLRRASNALGEAHRLIEELQEEVALLRGDLDETRQQRDAAVFLLRQTLGDVPHPTYRQIKALLDSLEGQS